ncbi:hypothetical protein [Budvicia aquatica]|uniref:Phage-related protein n=1 Tax=Budvicia aquatica TaxID=82979 RepID=A0A2C6DLX4_9GAMM|nr:hypothetical protein [Budvicia aquatica]PHI29693.1 hypothetical protein CRN84_10280 [Budvicia aquatica]VFS48076.1 Phage-related protein [Budvicia aquatica]
MSDQSLGAAGILKSLDDFRVTLPQLEKVNKNIDDTVKSIGVRVNINQSVTEGYIKQLSGNVNNLFSELSKVSSAVLERTAPVQANINQTVKKVFFISNITERIKNDISIKINLSQTQSQTCSAEEEKSESCDCVCICTCECECACQSGDGGGEEKDWKDWFLKVLGVLADVITVILGWKAVFGKLGPIIKALIGPLLRIGGLILRIGLLTAVISYFGSVVSSLFSGLKSALSSIGAAIKSGYSKAKTVVSGVAGSVVSKAKTAYSAGKRIAGKVGSAVVSKAKSAYSTGKNIVSKGAGIVRSVGGSALSLGKGLFDKLSSFVKPAVAGGKSLASKGANAVKSLAGSAVSKGKDLLSKGSGLFSKMAGPILSVGKSLLSKVPNSIKSVAGSALSAGKGLLTNGKVLGTIGRIASVGLRVGRMATPLGWASLAAEGAIRLGYHAYKKYQKSAKEKEAAGETGSADVGKSATDVYPQTVTPGMAASAGSPKNYTINSTPQFQINILPGTPEQQINDIRQAASEGVKQGEKQLTATVTGGLS